MGGPGRGDDLPSNIEFSIASGGYDVHTNMGGTEGIMSTSDGLVRHLDPSQGAYRVNAAAAKFSRLVAEQMYGPHRPHGYIYGASGGAFQTIAAAENTMGVWDGAVPEVMGTPNSIPSNFTIETYGLRVISPASFAKIVDALAPGGSGDPFAGLSPDEHGHGDHRDPQAEGDSDSDIYLQQPWHLLPRGTRHLTTARRSEHPLWPDTEPRPRASGRHLGVKITVPLTRAETVDQASGLPTPPGPAAR